MKKIEEFRNTHISIFWNELGLVVWKEYIMLQDLPDYKKWEKYKLKKIVFSDAVFESESWEEQVFLDKEFYEYWRE